jgi:hypothetical protein
MRKISVFAVAFILALSLAACGDNTVNRNVTSALEDNPAPLVEQIVQSELRNMTVDDVRSIAENIGPDLTMNDLREYAVDDLGDGLYGYRVVMGVDPYNLVVASDDMQTVLYTKFFNPLYGGLLGDNSSATIDIRYFDVDMFITDGTQALIHQLPEAVVINDVSIVGAWISETGSVTHFYEDDTGRTESDDGIYEFSWRVVSLTEAAKDSLRGYRVRDFYRVLSDTPEGIHWGGNLDAPMTDGWSAEGYILVLNFDGIQIPFDYAFSMDGRDKLILNTGSLGEILAPRPNIEIRFQWVTLTRES